MSLAAASLFTLASACSTILPMDSDTWFNNPAIQQGYLPALLETLKMTGWSSLATVLLGLPLGLVLVGTSSVGLFPNKIISQILSFIVNVGRSFPFIILIIAIMPITKFVVGTKLGWKAAAFPLVVAAVPFFARLVETNILGVSQGKIEAAQMMGASRVQIMLGVQVKEALPALIQSTTVLVITLIGYSAMAGAVGGGGLGQMAISYGWNQFMTDVMVLTVVGILVIVQLVQMLGDMCSRLVDHS